MVCEDTLRIRNMPNDLSDEEKEDLLKHFGAVKVKIITSSAKQKSVIFAKFNSKDVAKNVLLRLHQISILNCRLCVEYAQHDIGQSKPLIKSIENTQDTNKKHYKAFVNKLNAWNSIVGFHQPPPAHLKYVYPKPNRATINNIAHALASVPKFYTQVLHLMNKMNLPPPFSDVPDPPKVAIPQINQQLENSHKSSTEPNNSSESEIESDTEDTNRNKEIIPVKRKLPQKKAIKRPKFIKPSVAPATTSIKTQDTAENVFDKVEMHTQRKIELKLPSENVETRIVEQSDNSQVQVINNGESTNEENMEKLENSVISEEELNNNRIPLKDLSVLPVFKEYHPGVPTSKLYIKNISKTVEVSDLEYIYKRYIEISDDNKESQFNIRLMKEGKMKGQAFVTLDNVSSAQKAVKETNGFILKEKPLVVVFAKSATSKK